MRVQTEVPLCSLVSTRTFCHRPRRSDRNIPLANASGYRWLRLCRAGSFVRGFFVPLQHGPFENVRMIKRDVSCTKDTKLVWRVVWAFDLLVTPLLGQATFGLIIHQLRLS